MSVGFSHINIISVFTPHAFIVYYFYLFITYYYWLFNYYTLIITYLLLLFFIYYYYYMKEIFHHKSLKNLELRPLYGLCGRFSVKLPFGLQAITLSISRFSRSLLGLAWMFLVSEITRGWIVSFFNWHNLMMYWISLWDVSVDRNCHVDNDALVKGHPFLQWIQVPGNLLVYDRCNIIVSLSILGMTLSMGLVISTTPYGGEWSFPAQGEGGVALVSQNSLLS